MSYEKKGRDHHGDRYVVQGFPAHPNALFSWDGAVYLELRCKETGTNSLHEYTPRQARKLAARLLAASTAAEESA